VGAGGYSSCPHHKNNVGRVRPRLKGVNEREEWMLETTSDAYVTLRFLAHEIGQLAPVDELKDASEEAVESFLTAKAVLLGMELCLVNRDWVENIVRLIAEDVDSYENAISQVTGMISHLEEMLENYKLEEENDIGE